MAAPRVNPVLVFKGANCPNKAGVRYCFIRAQESGWNLGNINCTFDFSFHRQRLGKKSPWPALSGFCQAPGIGRGIWADLFCLRSLNMGSWLNNRSQNQTGLFLLNCPYAFIFKKLKNRLYIKYQGIVNIQQGFAKNNRVLN